jgi:hypothetical protein
MSVRCAREKERYSCRPGVRGSLGSPAMAMNDVGVCGAAALIPSSLAVDSLGFWEGDACRREGVL